MTKMTNEQLKESLEAKLTVSEIAKKFGMTDRAVQVRKAKLAKSGYSPEHDMVHQVPEGFLLKGQSTYYNKEGKPTQRWVKSAIDRDKQIELIQEFILGMKDDLPRELPVVNYNHINSPELLNQFTVTDYHLGMLAWDEESGDNWDMKIATDLIIKWFAEAIRCSPMAQTAVLAQLGDFLHWDGLDAITPSSGHVLDADTRFQKLARAAIYITRTIIKVLLEKHEKVHVIFAEGNHDMASSIWMREFLTVLYEDEPRITIDQSPDPYYCYVHGETSLFYHHGHKKRMDGLSDVFAAKFRKELGNSTYSYAHVGHLHHHRVIETSLMKIEQHQTLAAKDAYASRGGWLSKRAATVITYHKKFGEVCRATITPEMVG